MMKRLLLILTILVSLPLFAAVKPSDYVDPKIGSEGLGRVFIGPSCPFGMVKPSPDCTSSPNSGWLPMPERVDGFAQVHVSGTGGGPKYGNILIQPYTGTSAAEHFAHRAWEKIELGYYATEYEENAILTEVTTAERASAYRITYPTAEGGSLAVDCGFFLGENPVPKAREAQQFEGSWCSIDDDHTITGWQTISGGWNNGAAYTVFFCLKSDAPFVDKSLWEKGSKTGADVSFSAQKVNVKIGISFLSIEQARENLASVATKSFDEIRSECVSSWDSLLTRVDIQPMRKFNGRTDEQYLRMFYTGLYHTMIMPVDRTGDWAPANGEVYYDDYYALWDTYRTSCPLITILDPQREVDIVNAMLTIYKADGYMPDARSGNSNGRTQGGSNAEILIADAFVKGLKGIDYELALEAMVKDAEAVPADDEAEGRGGLEEYNALGYIPWGIPRAGNRTVEYAYCDYAIYLVASGLGHDDIAKKYLERSKNWKNLWRADYQHDGVSGFIMPRAEDGSWLDELPFGHSGLRQPTFTYTPVSFEGPWYTKWWSDFFYEATSWEYSLSVPHDVDGLIELCGGPEAFLQRLDIFFDKEYYNVNNEPSFLSPCLYHWIGRQDLSSARVLNIIDRHFGDGSMGLPGNDDSGAMSSWLAFHMTGLYPVAGQNLYLIHTPSLKSSVFHLDNGNDFVIKAKRLSDKRTRIISVKLNGVELDGFSLTHDQIVAGGELVLKMGKALKRLAYEPNVIARHKHGGEVIADTLRMTCALHGQTRRYDVILTESNDSLYLDWGIERNLKWQSGWYAMSPKARETASMLSFRQTVDGDYLTLDDSELFAIVPFDFYTAIKNAGRADFSATTWVLLDKDSMALSTALLHVKDVKEGAEMWILDREDLPLIWKMSGNPLEVDWTFSSLSKRRNAILNAPDKTGGIYYAYPEPETVETEVPKGYELFYVSHYGRHGSRYITEDARYTVVLDFLEAQNRAGNLTEEGQALLGNVRQLWAVAEGHGGQLSSIGVAQHRGIAQRLYQRNPALFDADAKVVARSSTSGRCIASMNAFCDQLQALSPSLIVPRDSSEANMSYVAYKSPEVIELGSEEAPWREEFHAFQERNIITGRFFKALLKNPGKVIDPMKTMENVYWLAVGMQDIPVDIDLYRYFTAEELFGIWRTIDYRMYLVNCNCPAGEGIGPASAKSLLENILECADAAVSGNGVAADLRFGHDTNLIRLLALMGVSGCDAVEADPERYWEAWQDFAVSPMAANLQLLFYRNASGDVLVKMLLNERETVVSALAPEGVYCPWTLLSAHLASKLGS